MKLFLLSTFSQVFELVLNVLCLLALERLHKDKAIMISAERMRWFTVNYFDICEVKTIDVSAAKEVLVWVIERV